MKPNLFSVLFASLILIPSGSFLTAQDATQGPAPVEQAAPQAQPLTQDQLQNLVAPLALYPDNLLSQILVASTYPLEVVEAGQWLQQNRNLRGPDLVSAARQQPWDASVQALVVFPDVVSRLNSDIRWTTDLGNAFLAQQSDVMNAVQTLRAEARSSGQLQSNAQQTVTTQTQGPQTAIQIQPADPQVVYVPAYNPENVWGPPAYGYYPPLYYPYDGFSWGFGIPIGGFYGGLGWGGWGWGPNWFGGGIFLNSGFYGRYGYGGFRGGVWAHNPEHRMGVPYANSRMANNFRGAGSGFSGRAVNGQRYSAPGGNFGNRAGSNQGWNHIDNRSQGNGMNSGANRGGQSFQSSPSNGSGYRSTPSFSGGRSTPSYQSSPSNGGGRSAPSYQSSPSYGGGRSAPSYQSSPNYGGGRSAPSYQSSPNYGGGRSAPSYRSSPSNGGGGSRSSPSYSGGPSAPSGHSSGGGGGGSHSSHR